MAAPPTIYAIAGGPAAGKSTFVSQALQQQLLPTTAFVHDCDAVTLSLPGFQQQLAATKNPAQAWIDWELQARAIAESQLAQHIAAKKDVIYDRTCALESSLHFFRDVVNNHGYKLIMYLLHVPLELAHARAILREATTQKHVPPEIITERHNNILKLWPEYLQLATEAYVLDSSDIPVNPIANYKDGKLEVLDPTLFKKFCFN